MNKPIRSFKDLDVYQTSYRDSILVCKNVVPNLPPEERYDLSDQLRRSSKAVPRLIAEGYGKRHQKRGFQKYLDDAISESNETQVGLCHVRDLYGREVGVEICEKLTQEYDIISRQLYRLRESWQTFSSSGLVSKPIPKPKSLGFTLIELLLVIAIIAIIASASAPFYSRFVAQNNLEVSTDKVISTIRKAQSYAMDGKDNSTWGFCMSGNNLRLFRGTCASPTFNEDFDLTGVTVSGLNETTFSGLTGKRGEPSSSLSITVSNDIGSVSVSLNRAGGLDVN